MENLTFQHPETVKQIYRNTSFQTEIFRLLELNQGEVKTMTCHDSSYIFCFDTGDVEISCIKYGNLRCKKHQMILIPRGTTLQITGGEVKNKTLIINCVEFTKTHDGKLFLNQYMELKERTIHQFTSTPIKQALLTCVKSITGYLKQGVVCEKLYRLKLDEVAACIEHNYTSQEITQLFYPIIARDSSFKNFVISNYSHECNVTELIKKSYLCKTVFYKKFHEEFGITAKQWMLKQKMKLIENMIADRSLRIKDIIIHFGFTSHEQFYIFCRRHFHCTPTELKMRARQLANYGN